MKVSTILLTTIFTGAVCFMGMHTSHQRRTVLFNDLDYRHDWDHRHEQMRHATTSHSMSSSESAQLRKLRKKDSKLKKQMREIEDVLKKIEKSKEYLKDRMTEWSRQMRFDSIDDPDLEKKLRMAAGDSQATLLAQYKSLEEDEAQFREFLEQCRGELATLKVKIDLYDLSAKKEDLKEFLSEEMDRSPVEDLAKARNKCRGSSW